MPVPAPLFALEVNTLMAGFGRPWCIAGHWALDLLSPSPPPRPMRPGPVLLAIFRHDQQALRDYLFGWQFEISAAGGVCEPWGDERWIEQPLYEVHAHQPLADPSRLRFELMDVEGEHWLYRRRQQVQRPHRELIHHTAQGIPVLAPEVALLCHHDDPDAQPGTVEAILDRLDAARRRWLQTALPTVNPDHPWLARLERSQ